MTDLFEIRLGIELVLALAMFGVKAFALVDVIARPAEAFTYADKQTKQLWLLLLGLSVLVNALLWSPIQLLNLIGIVIALVYLADVRPAVRTMPRRR